MEIYWKVLLLNHKIDVLNLLNSRIFAGYFKSVNDPESIFFQPDEDILLLNETYLQGELQCMFKDLNVSIQYDEVLKACKQLKTGKSSCTYQMLNDFVMYGCKNDIFIV